MPREGATGGERDDERHCLWDGGVVLLHLPGGGGSNSCVGGVCGDAAYPLHQGEDAQVWGLHQSSSVGAPYKYAACQDVFNGDV